MQRLTVNQLIFLLAIHRGTLDNEMYVGTKNNDLKVLGRLGLMERKTPSFGQQSHQLTPRGNLLVTRIQDHVGHFLLNVENAPGVVGTQELTLHVDASDLQGALAPVLDGLRQFSHMTHGGFEPEAAPIGGTVLANVDGNKGEFKSGGLFLVAAADVELVKDERPESEGDFESINLVKVDSKVYGTEEQATEVAVDRAKGQPGSRHLVLKAVAAHEVAVPVKSVRL